MHTGHVPWTVVVQPAFLLGLAFQLPFALAALLIAWALDSAARAVGRALGSRPRDPLSRSSFPSPFASSPFRARPASHAGYGERAPPFARRP